MITSRLLVGRAFLTNRVRVGSGDDDVVLDVNGVDVVVRRVLVVVGFGVVVVVLVVVVVGVTGFHVEVDTGRFFFIAFIATISMVGVLSVVEEVLKVPCKL